MAPLLLWETHHGIPLFLARSPTIHLQAPTLPLRFYYSQSFMALFLTSSSLLPLSACTHELTTSTSLLQSPYWATLYPFLSVNFTSGVSVWALQHKPKFFLLTVSSLPVSVHNSIKQTGQKRLYPMPLTPIRNLTDALPSSWQSCRNKQAKHTLLYSSCTKEIFRRQNRLMRFYSEVLLQITAEQDWGQHCTSGESYMDQAGKLAAITTYTKVSGMVKTQHARHQHPDFLFSQKIFICYWYNSKYFPIQVILRLLLSFLLSAFYLL